MNRDLMDHVFAVIMAGGGGTRLWPISRREHPKHTLPLLGQDSLFEMTIARLEGFIPPERILVVTTADQATSLQAQAARISASNYLLEPQPRGTASVVGLAAAVLAKRDPQAVMLVLPSDHFIRDNGQFQKVMQAALQVAQDGYLVTLGIQPASPSTGYGYIQQGAALEGSYDLQAYRVLRFTEKPDEATAQAMIARGDHTWNSGMFAWRAGRILDEMERLMPDLSSALRKITSAWGTPGQEEVLRVAWAGLKTETIDYGVMEGARDVAVLPASGLGWSDVGAWDALFDLLPADAQGNVSLNSDHIALDTNNTLVVTREKKIVVTIGVEDLVVVDSGDALLVCRRDQAQQVKQAIEKLKAEKKEEYL